MHRAEIVNMLQALTYFGEKPEVRELVQKLADEEAQKATRSQNKFGIKITVD